MQSKEELLIKLFNNECSRKELEHLLDLIKQDPQNSGPEVMSELFKQLELNSHYTIVNKKKIHNQVIKSIKQSTATTSDYNNRRKKIVWLGKVAAVLFFVVSIILISQYLSGNDIIITQTDYGEVKEITLPDSSIVTLNGNSTLRYAPLWDESATRKVFLKGEAYFKVRKKENTLAKFQVVTDDLVVEVLGTIFNVNTHLEETSVFLEEGKVLVSMDNTDHDIVRLQPGEIFRYSAVNNKLTAPRPIVTESPTSWKDGFLTFDKVPLKTVLDQLASSHNLKYKIEDTELADKVLQITIPLQDLDEAMTLLVKTIPADIVKEENVFNIRKKVSR